MSKYTLPNATVREQDLAGKVAIVTGASRGIGRGIAFHLAARGATILGTCSSESSMKNIASLKDEIDALYSGTAHKPPQTIGVAASLLEPEKFVAAVVGALDSSHHLGGRVDILVQNAAVAEARLVDDIDGAHVRRMLAGNLEAAVLLVQALLPRLQPNSRVVNVSSGAARSATPGSLVYAAAKAGLEALTRNWAAELGRRPGMEGTTFNALSVGATDTDLLAEIPDEVAEGLVEREKTACNVGPRIGTVDDIAEIAGWLCSEKSRWVTGSVMCANGGVYKIL
ncbi:hypothetical protein SLS64_009693 [Diaporthe eres]|uniref:Ketoreductase domain-containing protein n=1 Tax=Diaporthe eres TaxID=83184 RepID=A0ABR1NZA6_DIAER